MATDSEAAKGTSRGTLLAVAVGTDRDTNSSSVSADDSAPVADKKPMELVAPIVSLFANERTIMFIATDVLTLCSAAAVKKAKETNIAASFRTSEESISGSGSGTAEAG